ncbi:MAG: transposase [Parcubacteria group bacterium]
MDIKHLGRKRNRLKYFDYSQSGWYFITICVKDRKECFGEIKNGIMILNEYGKIAEKCWLDIIKHFPNVVLDVFIIMPNHIHGILIIRENGNGNNVVGNKDFCSLPKNEIPWQTKLSKSLPSIVRGFKIGVTKYFREKQNHDFQWQKSYYDNIIRDEKALNNIRHYIKNNPAKWFRDRNNKEDLYC